MKAETVSKCKIVIGCFVVEVLINGVARLSSIYFVESINRYNVDRKQASFPFVLVYMVKNLSGPLVGYLEQILGTTWIITIGCIMATLGIGGCFFAEDILVITLLWGVGLGLSYGFANSMIPPLLNQCFTHSKSKANAFVSSGSCVGGALLPVVTVATIKSFGTSGSFILLSAIVAHTIPACLLMYNSGTKPKIKISKVNIKKVNNREFKSPEDITEINNISGNLCMTQACKCLNNYVPENIYSEIESNSSNNSCREKVLGYINETTNCGSLFPCSLHIEKSAKEENQNLKKQQIHDKKFTFRYFKIFIDRTFIAILFIHGINTVIITSLWTVILDFIKDKGVPETLEIYYVVLLPVTDLFGRIFSGYVIDKNILRISNLFLLTYLLEAVVLIVFIHLKNCIMLMLCEMLISFCLGMTIILEIMVTHEFMEGDSRKMAMSCRLMLYAPLSFTISPMIGYFRGGYGSYDYMLYILSTLSLLCGSAAYLLPHLSRKRSYLTPTDAAKISRKSSHMTDNI